MNCFTTRNFPSTICLIFCMCSIVVKYLRGTRNMIHQKWNFKKIIKNVISIWNPDVLLLEICAMMCFAVSNLLTNGKNKIRMMKLNNFKMYIVFKIKMSSIICVNEYRIIVSWCYILICSVSKCWRWVWKGNVGHNTHKNMYTHDEMMFNVPFYKFVFEETIWFWLKTCLKTC